ncbi:hypothetical protein T484DRAFT_1980492, partial [Baffinella frigidus]
MTAHMLPHMLPTPRRKLFALFPTKAPLALPATSALAVLILLASLLLSVPVPCRGVGGSNAPQLSSRADPSLFRPHAGKAVHVQGRLFPVELDDHEFHFVRSGVRLERYVESFQWEHDGRGGYRKAGVATDQDSGRCGTRSLPGTKWPDRFLRKSPGGHRGLEAPPGRAERHLQGVGGVLSPRTRHAVPVSGGRARVVLHRQRPRRIYSCTTRPDRDTPYAVRRPRVPLR